MHYLLLLIGTILLLPLACHAETLNLHCEENNPLFYRDVQVNTLMNRVVIDGKAANNVKITKEVISFRTNNPPSSSWPVTYFMINRMDGRMSYGAYPDPDQMMTVYRCRVQKQKF